jgi:hypothetical protein
MIVARLEELRDELARAPERAPTVLGADFTARRAKLQRSASGTWRHSRTTR